MIPFYTKLCVFLCGCVCVRVFVRVLVSGCGCVCVGARLQVFLDPLLHYRGTCVFLLICTQLCARGFA